MARKKHNLFTNDWASVRYRNSCVNWKRVLVLICQSLGAENCRKLFSAILIYIPLSTDTEPPRFRHCPSNVQIVSGKKWSKIVLPPSYHTDNVGVTFFTTSIRNGSELTWGQYNITYTVSDKAGNTAECLFHISIAGEYIYLNVQVKEVFFF